MRINPKSEELELRYASWVSMLIDLIDPKDLYVIGGRGVAKTSDLIAKRAIRVVEDMPRGVFGIVSNTYVNALSNIIPNILAGWERQKFIEGTHYILDEQPGGTFKQPLLRLSDWIRTICCYNGAMFLIRSTDRPSTNAGISIIHLFGDEAKHQREDKLKKAIPTLRGDAMLFQHSHYFLGSTFTTDMPNPADGEDDWILRMKASMDIKQIYYILQTALIVNDERWKLFKAQESKAPESEILLITANLERWEALLNRARMNSTFFYMVSSLANIDFLTFQYILNNRKTLEYPEFKRVILSIVTNVERGRMFYPNLKDNHFYIDGYNYEYYDQFGIKDNIQQNSKGLRYVDHNRELDAGMDVGNMMSMVIGQDTGPSNYILKNLYTLSPEWVRDLADKFIKFFEPHRYKLLNLYYDRAANNYKDTGHDIASEIKHNIEHDKSGNATGWQVNLMSVGQGNISHQEEFDLCNVMMSGNNSRLPKLLIDKFECKELKSSLEMAEAKTVVGKNGRKSIKKVKTSEKKRLSDLPMGSTNMSDAFKYYLCRRKYLYILKNKSSESFAD